MLESAIDEGEGECAQWNRDVSEARASAVHPLRSSELLGRGTEGLEEALAGT